MARHECTRCHETYHDSDGEHLCKDLKARLKRQSQAVGMVVEAMHEFGLSDADVGGNTLEDVALEIIKRIGGRDLGT